MAEKLMPGPEHDRLQAFEGSWEGTKESPKGKWRGRMMMRRALDGLFILQDFTQERDGQPEYAGHGVLGFDPSSKSYTWYWVDTMGSVSQVARGVWDGPMLRFEGRSDKGEEARYSYRFESNDQLQFCIERKTGGKWSQVSCFSYDRRLASL